MHVFVIAIWETIWTCFVLINILNAIHITGKMIQRCSVNISFFVCTMYIPINKKRSTQTSHILDTSKVEILLLTYSLDDVIKWKNFPCYWPFVRGFHRSPLNSPPEGQWREALMFTLIRAWTNGWANNRDAGDLRRNRSHYDTTVMLDTSQLDILGIDAEFDLP